MIHCFARARVRIVIHFFFWTFADVLLGNERQFQILGTHGIDSHAPEIAQNCASKQVFTFKNVYVRLHGARSSSPMSTKTKNAS
jgi:hypothetical protein